MILIKSDLNSLSLLGWWSTCSKLHLLLSGGDFVDMHITFIWSNIVVRSLLALLSTFSTIDTAVHVGLLLVLSSIVTISLIK